MSQPDDDHDHGIPALMAIGEQNAEIIALLRAVATQLAALRADNQDDLDDVQLLDTLSDQLDMGQKKQKRIFHRTVEIYRNQTLDSVDRSAPPEE